jgi:polyisoprenoid-binding protein YceI
MRHRLPWIGLAGTLAAALGTLAAQPGAYRIHPGDATRLELEVEKSGLYSGKSHIFLFSRYQGDLDYDAANPEASRLTLVIEAASAELQDKWVNEKQFKEIVDFTFEEMLAADRYPEIRFRSKQVTRKGEFAFDVEGDLTIRDKTRPVRVAVTLENESGREVAFKGKAVIDMTAYGLKPPRAALGLIGTKPEMQFRFFLKATRHGPS